MSKHQIREDLVMNTKVEKMTYEEVDAKMRDAYFTNKVDMTPATIKTVSSCLDGKTETVVSRILEIDCKPFMGIDYADGEAVGAWMADAKGRRVPIKMPEEQKEQKEASKVLEKISSSLLKRVQKEKDINKKAKKATQLINKTKELTRTTRVSQERDFS